MEKLLKEKKIPLDLKKWMSNEEVKSIFLELGYELIYEKKNIVDDAFKTLNEKMKDCPYFKSGLQEILEIITFVAHNNDGVLFGYLHKINDYFLAEPFTISYDNETFNLEMGILYQAILWHCVQYNEEEYEKIENFFDAYNIGLNWTEDEKKLYKDKHRLDIFYELQSKCKYGRKIVPKKVDFTKEEFLLWREPRLGKDNPTKLNSLVWEYGVCSYESAYGLNKKFNYSSTKSATWCFSRIGKTVTLLADGREIHIAGEHEDFYDSDFYIYNDVIVIEPDDSIIFYNYPKDVFLPTDFHSATLIEDIIVIIGNISYPEYREIGVTQIYQLDIDSFKITKIESIGNNPKWISRHKAILSEDKKSIKIIGGQIDVGGNRSLIENIDEWELNVKTWEWRQLTDKQWKRFEIKRKDNDFNHLYKIRNVLFDLEHNWQDDYTKALEYFKEELGFHPNIKLIKELYFPNIPYNIVVEKDNYRVYKIEVKGIIVRFNEEDDAIVVTIEGYLEDKYIDEIIRDTLEKLSILERCEYVVESF